MNVNVIKIEIIRKWLSFNSEHNSKICLQSKIKSKINITKLHVTAFSFQLQRFIIIFIFVCFVGLMCHAICEGQFCVGTSSEEHME